MASYYYFGATLPSLSWRGAMPLSSREFLERCAIHLSPRDLAIVGDARPALPADGGLPAAAGRSRMLAAYYRWELALRNELARLRAGRLGQPAEKHVRPGSVEWDGLRAAQSAFQAESPLEGEIVMERERWNVVERLQVGHYFDTEALVAYGLKLRILERVARFEVERGKAAYGEIYDDILGAAGAPGQDGKPNPASEDTGVTT
ncbi:MAG: DUF2764 family protein [Spirochaetales bacterium]|nr:DUF2764 family protein [Spirochaetales bacterium]